MTGEQSRGDHSRSGLVLIAPGNRMQARLDVRRAILRSARLEAARVHAHVRPLAGAHLCARVGSVCMSFLCFLDSSLLLQRAPCLNHMSNLHPSHAAAPPRDAMALAISVGDTHDTEGRAD